MSKRELIDAIIQHNRTATPEFLARFAENELKAYLDRVVVVCDSNGSVRIQTTVGAEQQLMVA